MVRKSVNLHNEARADLLYFVVSSICHRYELFNQL